jgi:molybdate transport system substrate-binding protein
MIQTVRGVSSMATRQILADLVRGYETETGWTVNIQSMGGVVAAQRVRDGEPFDIVVLAADALEKLEAENHIVAGSRVGFARSAIAMAVKAGSTRPRWNDESDVKQAVLNARTVAYSTGPSGVHLANLLKKWRIDQIVEPRLVAAPPGVPVGALIARGDAEIGFQQLSELMGEPGAEIVDLLPEPVQSITLFSIGLGIRSTNILPSRGLYAYLTSTKAHEAIRRHGMEPA